MNVVDQKAQFKSFYKLHEQDQHTFLMNHTERFNIKETCEAPKNINFAWNYYVTQNGKKDRVCKSFLQKLFEVTNERMKTALRFCKQG